MADKLNDFEVFPDRELKVGHPIVARLVGRRFDQLLDGGAYDRPFDARFGKAPQVGTGGKAAFVNSGSVGVDREGVGENQRRADVRIRGMERDRDHSAER